MNEAGTDPSALDGAPLAEPDAASRIADSLIEAIEAGDWESGLRLLGEHWLEAWFYIPPDRLRALLAGLPAEALMANPAAQYLLSLLSGAPRPADAGDVADPRIAALMETMRLADLRFAGRMRESLAGTHGLLEQLRVSESALIDSSSGLVPLAYLQAGLTALLAGELDTATAWFTRARDTTGSAMRFVFRDATAKLAVLHALAGSVTEARALLREASTAPRSRAWTEHWIDSTALIARVLLEPEDREQGAALARMPWREFGEMWPFAVAAHLRVLLSAADTEAAHHALTTTEAMDLPGARGDGIVGAVIPVGLATTALARGNAAEARRRIEQAPGDTGFCHALLARMELNAGRPSEATRQATLGLVEFGGFDQLAFEFTGIIATAELAAGDSAAARTTALELIRRWHEVPTSSLARIPTELIAHAKTEWQDDPELLLLATLETKPLFPGTAGVVELSDRELEVLLLLSTSATRKEMCERLFISANTLASHIKSIYRKLGVASREEAVHQAGARGLLH